LTAPPPYRGRFAPSPTGPLHFGSLIAAVGSYLDARHRHGRWFVRMEDLDPPREMPGAADRILRSLEAHGLTWDDSVLYQSQRHEAYAAALDTLKKSGSLFCCSCTRAVLGPGGHCGRRCSPKPGEATSERVVVAGGGTFDDFILGPQEGANAGDAVLRRKDGLFAYALAVVVDDAYQAISHVLRGQDLLGETSGQIELFERLNQTPPGYGHLPLLCDRRGHKLSKQTGARALDDHQPLANLRSALHYLGQGAAQAEAGSVEELLAIAIAHWQRQPLIDNAGRPLPHHDGIPR